MKECGTVIRIDLDFKNAFNSAGHSCLWAILRGLGVPDVDFLEELYSKSWMRITVGTGCSAPIQLDTGTVQGSVLSPLLFDLFLNALLRLLDATGITHGIKRTPQWNHAAFADDLSIYVRTVHLGCTSTPSTNPEQTLPTRSMEHFCDGESCFTTDPTSFRSNRHHTKDRTFLDRAGIFDFRTIALGETICEPVTTFREFSQFIAQMPSHKAPGISEVPADLFKQVPISYQKRIIS